MISVPQYGSGSSHQKYSIRVGISLCTVVKARQSRVTGPRSWSPRSAHPVPREGVVIMLLHVGSTIWAITVWATVPSRWAHARPTRPGAGTTAEYAPQGTEGHQRLDWV